MAEAVKKPISQVYEGSYPLHLPTEWMDDLLHHFTIRDSDILLATYPRSGTTWLQNILYILKHKQKLDSPMYSNMPFLIFPQYETREELMAKAPELKYMTLLKAEFESLPGPRIIKTHLAWYLVPKNPYSRYIYCYRNPKDVVVSLYDTVAIKMIGFNGTFSEFFELFMKGEVEFGSWFDHVLGWWGQKDNTNVYFLSYEELQSNFKEKVVELAAFTGLSFSAKVFDLLAKEGSFSSMKSNQLISEMKKVEGKDTSLAHVRKGGVGRWKEVLTQEQSLAIDRMLEEKLKGSPFLEKLMFELS